MKQRAFSRISPYKQLRVQVATDTVCFTGLMRDIAYAGSCIHLRTEETLPIYVDNRLSIRCQLKDLNETWDDEVFVGKVRWIRKQPGETILGVEFLDTDEHYHPRISSLGKPEPS